MNTLTKLIIASIVAILMHSCNYSIDFGTGVDGNGEVVSEKRDISEDFDTVKVSMGLDLHITQGNNKSLTVEADENLHDLIMTKVEDNVLSIYSTESIRTATSKKITLNINDINTIKATSGSNVYNVNTFKTETLNLTATSGADIVLNIDSNTLSCKSTSGSDIELSGVTKNLTAQATSGSDIIAVDLEAEITNAKATSGADISVNTSKQLIAKATSGGDIKYIGSPDEISTSDSSSGDVYQIKN